MSHSLSWEANRAAIASLRQLVSIEQMVIDQGAGRGTPVLAVRNPRGISCDLLLDRGLDIGWADAAGMPLAWRSERGYVPSTRHDPHGTGWTQTFGGGLLATCGLETSGEPSVHNGREFGLHGRVGHLPVEGLRWDIRNDEPVLEVRGDVHEVALGGSNLVLHRTLRLWLDRPRVEVRDVVENLAFASAGIMFRHHYNLGFPLVSTGSTVDGDFIVDSERDQNNDLPSLPLSLKVADGPVSERVYYLRPVEPGSTDQTPPKAGGRQVIRLQNASGDTEVEVSYEPSHMPWLILWRDESAGVNVLGIEPSTSLDGGRAQAADSGDLIELEPRRTLAFASSFELRPPLSPTDDQPLS